MKHYLWYDSTGLIRGDDCFAGGFPDDCDPADMNTAHPVAQKLRASRMADPAFAGWVPFNCVCLGEEFACPCAAERVGDHYVLNGALTLKPAVLGSTLDVLVNGSIHDETAASDPFDAAPGSNVTFQLRANAVPDGHVVTLKRSTHVQILRADTILTITGGLSNVVTLKAPAQGNTGWVYGSSKLLSDFGLHVRGWA